MTLCYIETPASNALMLTENRVANIPKNGGFSPAILKPILHFLYQNGKHVLRILPCSQDCEPCTLPSSPQPPVVSCTVCVQAVGDCWETALKTTEQH